MAYDFNSITEVMLASGSHKNPKEGMCAMEMVAWFEGEPHSDKPACASAVLCAYVIRFNDRMPNEVRNRLLKPMLPFLAGTFEPASEQKRAGFLAMWAVNKVLPIILRQRGFDKLAKRCEAAKDLQEADAAAYAAYAADAEQIWQCAVDGLRAATMVGRCDGFTLDSSARHEALRELVTA